jgi:uncharacterized protein YqgC (DUF456 family)
MLLVTVVSIALMVAGVILTAVPEAPGGMRWPLAGMFLYWWASGYSEPALPILLALTTFAVLIKLSGMMGPVIKSKVAGTAKSTTFVGGIASSIAFFLWGFKGMILGLFLTTVLIEYWRRGDIVESLTAGVVVVLVSLASKTVKTLATVVFLVVMLGVIFI